MIGFDGGFSYGIPPYDGRGPHEPLTAEDITNPYRWAVILPAPDRREQIVRWMEREDERMYQRILDELDR